MKNLANLFCRRKKTDQIIDFTGERAVVMIDGKFVYSAPLKLVFKQDESIDFDAIMSELQPFLASLTSSRRCRTCFLSPSILREVDQIPIRRLFRTAGIRYPEEMLRIFAVLNHYGVDFLDNIASLWIDSNRVVTQINITCLGGLVTSRCLIHQSPENSVQQIANRVADNVFGILGDIHPELKEDIVLYLCCEHQDLQAALTKTLAEKIPIAVHLKPYSETAACYGGHDIFMHIARYPFIVRQL